MRTTRAHTHARKPRHPHSNTRAHRGKCTCTSTYPDTHAERHTHTRTLKHTNKQTQEINCVTGRGAGGREEGAGMECLIAALAAMYISARPHAEFTCTLHGRGRDDAAVIPSLAFRRGVSMVDWLSVYLFIIVIFNLRRERKGDSVSPPWLRPVLILFTHIEAPPTKTNSDYKFM